MAESYTLRGLVSGVTLLSTCQMLRGDCSSISSSVGGGGGGIVSVGDTFSYVCSAI